MKATYPLLAFADRLAGTLRLLRERIRDAVATEVGLVAGQALQNVLHSLIRGPEPRRDRAEIDRDDDADEPYVGDDAEDPYDDPPPERPGLPGPIPVPISALAPANFGSRVLNLWLARRAPALATLGAGLLTGLLAWCGSPALIASLVATAAECLVLNRWAGSLAM